VRELFEDSICVNDCYMSISENPSVLFNNAFQYECPGGGPRTKHVGIDV
jgi:hypothetical protein